MNNIKRKKTALILGAGFAGCTAAYLLRQKGFDITVLEKNRFPGGGCRTYKYGGHPYTLGPRIFFTKDEEVIKLMTSLMSIRQFYTKTWSYIAKDKQFYRYPIYAKDIQRMPDKDEIVAQLKERKNKKPSTENFKNYWLDAIGPNLYYKFMDEYSKKMWGVDSNEKLSFNFNWVNKGNTIREEDARLFGDIFQGYPSSSDGYNQFFNKCLEKCRIITECKIVSIDSEKREVKTNKGNFTGDVIINTISVDALFENKFGKLKYSGRKMFKVILPINQAFPDDTAWIHYSSNEPFTRITEFKKITDYKSKDTLLGIEIPTQEGQHYPLPVESERLKFNKYQELFPSNFYSIGRLGKFTYKGIPDVMRDAVDAVKVIIS